MTELSDEVLLGKSHNAGRSMVALAALATLGALLFGGIALGIRSGDMNLLSVLPAAGVFSVAAAYWVLAVAARRGDRNAVAIPAVVLTMVVGLLAISFGLARMRDASFGTGNGFQFVIILIIIWALVRDWKVLTELRRRDLWDRAFPDQKPTGAFCVIGGVLLAAGVLFFNVGMLGVGAQAAEAAAERGRQAQKFVNLIEKDQARFMQVFKKYAESGTQDAYADAVKEIDALAARRSRPCARRQRETERLALCCSSIRAPSMNGRRASSYLRPIARRRTRGSWPATSCTNKLWTSSTSRSGGRARRARGDSRFLLAAGSPVGQFFFALPGGKSGGIQTGRSSIDALAFSDVGTPHAS